MYKKRQSTYTAPLSFDMLIEEIDIPSGSDDDNLSETEEFVEQNVESPFDTNAENLSEDSNTDDDAGRFFQPRKWGYIAWVQAGQSGYVHRFMFAGDNTIARTADNGSIECVGKTGEIVLQLTK